MILANIARSGINVVSKRFMRRKINLKAWPNDWVPFHWKRPESRPGYYDAADLVDLGQPDPEQLNPDVRNSSELKKIDSNDPLRKIFSLSHAKRSVHNKALVNEHLNRLGIIHSVDYPNSLEAKIINLTFALRHTIERIQFGGDDGRYNGHIRQTANNIKGRRYRYLCDLKELNEDRFKRLITALNIEPKNNLINVPYIRPYRKIQMRKLAFEYARDLKEKKVEEFLKSIEKEKVDFAQEKKEALAWIEEQEKKLGITV